MTRLVLGTYNIQNTVAPANAERAARAFMGHGVQIGCTQEMPPDAAPHDIAHTKGARVILHDATVKLVKQRDVFLSTGRRVGYVPGRRTLLPDYHGTLAWFDIDTRIVPVLNVHTPAHNRWGGGRAAMWNETERAVAAVLEREHAKHGVAFAVGDWNRPLPGRHRDFPNLRAAGATSCWDGHRTEGTHGHETIDGIWALGDVKAHAPRVYAKGPSDHHPVVVEYVI